MTTEWYRLKAKELKKVTDDLKRLNPDPYVKMLIRLEDDFEKMVWRGVFSR